MPKNEAVEVLLSWGRSFMAASLSVYLYQLQENLPFDPGSILTAGGIAVLPVIIRWFDPMDKAFGRKF